MNQSEHWRDIPGYEGAYQASSLGRIKSLARLDTIGRPIHERILRVGLAAKKRDRPIVVLRRNDESIVCRVHQLIALTFLGIPPDGTEVNHIDTNPLNNRVDNLEYLTHQQNIDHARDNGLMKFGEQHPQSKLQAVQVSEIKRRLRLGESHRTIARSFGVSKGCIHSIAIGRSWRDVL